MPIANTNPLDSLKSILDMTKGKSTTTSTSSNISMEGTQELINSILRSNQGLASVAQGQKTAGLYNSSVNQQLINDLITSTSAKVAAAQAGTTTTQKTAAPVSKSDASTAILTLLGTQAAAKLLGPSFKGLAKKTGVDTWGDKLAESLGLGSGAAAGTASLGADAASIADLASAAGTSEALLNPTTLSAAGLDIGSTIGASLGLSSGTAGADTAATLATDAAATEATSAGLAGSGLLDLGAEAALPVVGGAIVGGYQAKQVADGDVGGTLDSFFPGVGSAVKAIFGW